MTVLKVNGKEIDVPADYTLLQACEEAGAEIPRFCFHERLSIAGNCRMCLVELKGAPKPIASCAWAVRDCRPGPNGEPPEVITRSAFVKGAREGVMEFLLINHPLDCPICDQGGECDLQDQAMAYGIHHKRFVENKRAVEDKYLGPLVKTSMNRCIHCTRCVRFATEIGGVTELGATGRGEDMEITTYLESAMTSELQGNVIDLCPVGALTSKPYAFQARPWELNKTETIDAMDAVGSNIRVDTRGREVMRILPRLHEGINEEWISDKTRFIWDGLRTQRLDRPYIRSRGKLAPASWAEAFAAIATVAKTTAGERIGAIAGDMATTEEMYALKQLMNSLGSSNIDCRQDGSALEPAFGRATYLFNPTIAGIEDADALLMIGTDPRHEAPIVNARIRKRWRWGDFPIALIGEKVDLTYPYQHLGKGTAALAELAAGKGAFAETLRGAKRPIILVGADALARPEGMSILREVARIAKDGDRDAGWNPLAILHTAAGRVGGLDIGFVPGPRGLEVAGMVEAAGAGNLDILFLLGADEIDVSALGNAFVVYIGSHGDAGAHRADVILPGAAYTEKNGTLVNTEGRAQQLKRAAFPPGEARDDWSILRALSEVIGHTLPFDSFAELNEAMTADHPHLAAVDEVTMAGPESLEPLLAVKGTIGSEPFGTAVADFYLTNPIARASAVMADCSALAAGRMAEAAE